MLKRAVLGRLVLALLCAISVAFADKNPSSSDYSKEPFVFESSVTKVSFETDGTGTIERTARARSQSDAGVQRFGVLKFGYQAATEDVEVAYIRVLKSDGTIVATPADSVQDMPAQITQEAPFYSDLREKHVAVKGL